jgi:hypothetical protein
MANFQAVFAVGDSLVTFLQNGYHPAAVGFPCTFKLFSSSDMSSQETATGDAVVSLYLHRITNDETARVAPAPGERPTLSLDLHYLVSCWGTSAQAEQTILTWTMQWLAKNPILDASVLSLSSANAGWAVGETIEITRSDLSLQDILRIWDSMGPKYRLTLSYRARVVRVELPDAP